MNRGKDEKIMGPMFPRLHVNDTEKGGPRAPPRNKMALYEQLSIPSQRFNPRLMPLNPGNTANLVPPASSSQGSGHERGMLFAVHLPPSTHPTAKMHACYSDLNTPLAQLEQKMKMNEDDFTVSIFVQSRTGQDHSNEKSSTGREILSSFSSANSGRSMKFQNAIDKEPKRTSIIGLNLRQEGRSQSKENSKETVPDREQSVKSASNLSAREKTDGLLKQTNGYLNQEHRDHPAYNSSRLQNTDVSLQQEYRAWSQPNSTANGDGVPNKRLRGMENGNYSFSRRDFRMEERSPGNPINDCENHENMTCGSLQTRNVDRGDNISETSMVDSIPSLGISPDDVVGIIGQKHFWKARREIANQQRVFAFQVFELHRLIKVQRLFAGSPHLLLEDDAYLGKPLKDSPAKKISLDYIVKPPPCIVNKDDSEKPSHNMECSAENAVGKTSFSSVQNDSQPSNYRPFSGNQPPEPATTDAKMGSWCSHQPSGHQWLIPVMSPSEGLIYKPYPAPGFMGPVWGGCGPPGSTPPMGNYLNPAYEMTNSHHHYQGIGVPSVSHGYFHPYGMPVMNPAISGSSVEQIDNFAGTDSHGHPGQLSGGGANFNRQHQSLCNVPSKKNGAISDVMKLHASKDTELQGSTASSPSERQVQTGGGHSMEGRNVLPLFPTLPAVQAPEGATQPQDSDQPTRVIKVVPHNARSATESVARIFQSIQEERKQYDLV